MTDDVSRETPRCWSYSLEGSRCEEDAGHAGEHAVRLSWTDEQAWTPAKGPLGAPGPAQAVLEGITPVAGVPFDMGDDAPEGPGVEVIPAGVCPSCDHAAHDEACERVVGRGANAQECGCKFVSVV